MDLLDAETTAEFRSAMRDVTDTFHRSPVTLRRAVGGDVPLLVGLTPAGDGQGEQHGELQTRETGEEIAERYTVRVNRDYLAEKGLVVNDVLQITLDDTLLIGGKRFTLASVADKAIFRGVPILAVLQAVR